MPTVREIRPQPGYQEAILSTPADIGIGGGAKGAGKSFALLMEPLRHKDVSGFGSVIFRRDSTQIKTEGGLWDTSEKIYPFLRATPNLSALHWDFPAGPRIKFAHLQHAKDVFSWDGSQIPLIGFDQLESFLESQFWYMLTCNRSVCGVRPYVRATCMTADTVIACADGILRRLDRCIVSTPIWSMWPATAGLMAQDALGTIVREAPVYRIKTTGSELRCTAEHRLFRWTPRGCEAVRVEALTVDDYIATPRILPHGSLPLNSDLSYLIGYTVGAGGMTGRRAERISWSEADIDHARYLAQIGTGQFGCKFGIHTRKAGTSYVVYSTGRNSNVRAFFDMCRDGLGPAATRAFPERFTGGDVESVRAVLQGIFDAEGHVSCDSIAIAIVSAVLAHQIKLLLRRWGIIARLDTYEPGGRRHRVYRLTLCGRQAASFVTQIGFRIARKREAADRLIARGVLKLVWRRNREVDQVPIDRIAIRHLRQFFGKSWWNKNRAIRRDTAHRICTAAIAAGINPEPLATWAAWAWERVRYIDPLDGMMPVYDVMLADVHAYVTGGVLSHNCNPVPADDPDGGWLHKFISWWLDEDSGYPRLDRAGKIRWMVRINDELQWADTREELYRRFHYIPHADLQPKSVTFVPGTLADNPILTDADPGYRATLMAMPLVDRERLLGGNWKVKATAGKVFNRAWFKLIRELPTDIIAWTRYWDKAGTEGGGKYSAGVLLGLRANRRVVIADVVRGQWSAGNRETVIAQTAAADMHRCGENLTIWIEQEPGSGGKESAENTVLNLAGYSIYLDRVTGSKIARAGPLSAQAEVGNIDVLDRSWTEAFLAEMQNFDGIKGYMDQADAASGGYVKLLRGGLGVPLEITTGSGVTLTEEEQLERDEAAREAAERAVTDAIQRNGWYWPGGR